MIIIPNSPKNKIRFLRKKKSEVVKSFPVEEEKEIIIVKHTVLRPGNTQKSDPP